MKTEDPLSLDGIELLDIIASLEAKKERSSGILKHLPMHSEGVGIYKKEIQRLDSLIRKFKFQFTRG